MIVDNLHFFCSLSGPLKANPVLIIYGDCMLPPASASQRVISISTKFPYVIQAYRRLKTRKPSPRLSMQFAWKNLPCRLAVNTFRNLQCSVVLVAPDAHRAWPISLYTIRIILYKGQDITRLSSHGSGKSRFRCFPRRRRKGSTPRTRRTRGQQPALRAGRTLQSVSLRAVSMLPNRRPEERTRWLLQAGQLYEDSSNPL